VEEALGLSQLANKLKGGEQRLSIKREAEVLKEPFSPQNQRCLALGKTHGDGDLDAWLSDNKVHIVDPTLYLAHLLARDAMQNLLFSILPLLAK